jgi:hypothetical protein
LSTACFSRAEANHHTQQVLSRKSGVITGDDVLALFQHAKDNGYAIPAINVGFLQSSY